MSKRQVYYVQTDSRENASAGFLNDYLGIKWPGSVDGLSVAEIRIERKRKRKFKITRIYKKRPSGPYKIT